MESAIAGYIKDIHDLFLNCQVTDANATSLILDIGIKRVADWAMQTGIDKKKVIFIGNGGSAAVANHKALDFWFTGKIRGLSFSDDALLTCVSNDFGYSQVFSKPLSMFADSGDILVVFSSSGNSENIISATIKARQLGCKIITFTGFKTDNRLRQLGDLNFYIPSFHYNKVESVHLLLCDCILELIVAQRRPAVNGSDKLNPFSTF